jgi:SAM-dependent methyltransferase
LSDTNRVYLKPEDVEAMLKLLVSNPNQLLLSPLCRRYLARARWQRGDKEIRSGAHDDLTRRIVEYAKRETTEDLFTAPHFTNLLLGPLSGIAPVSRYVDRLKVLTVGPRTEMEMFHLMALGFTIENIRAIDLVSTSPLIDAGDMHAMPYPDDSFDVVVANNCLGHSHDPRRAVSEMVRVGRDNGLLALANTFYEIDEQKRPGLSFDKFRTADSLARLAGESIGSVIVREDVDERYGARDALLICRLRK